MADYLTQLSDEERMRLFNGVGSWNSYDAGGKIPSFSMSDGPHGLRKQDAIQETEHYADLNRSRVATCFPTSSCMAASWDKSLLSELGKLLQKKLSVRKLMLFLDREQTLSVLLCAAVTLNIFQKTHILPELLRLNISTECRHWELELHSNTLPVTIRKSVARLQTQL